MFWKISDNINSINNNIICLPQDNNEIMNQENSSLKIPRNNMIKLILKDHKNCIHENDFTFYNIEKIKNNNGLLCHNFLYKLL